MHMATDKELTEHIRNRKEKRKVIQESLLIKRIEEIIRIEIILEKFILLQPPLYTMV